MQRICKTCKKKIFNSPSNFCSTTCVQKFMELRRSEYNKELRRAENRQPMIPFYNVHTKQWTNRRKELSDQQVDDVKLTIKTLYNPMENEYN